MRISKLGIARAGLVTAALTGTIGVLPAPQPNAAQPAAPPAKVAQPPSKPADVKMRFEKLAGQLEVFQTGEFVAGRGDDPRQIPHKKLAESWRAVHATLRDCKDDVADLVALLKHKDAKVRTLALAALFERQDPRVLPHFRALTADTAPTVKQVLIVRDSFVEGELIPQDFQKQTVGQVAQAFLQRWLEPAGYELKEFDGYWAARKDRKFCAGWFLARLIRAGQNSSAFDRNRAPLIHAVRKEVDALPAADRDWTLLWLAANQPDWSQEPAKIFASEEELVAAAKRLGPERLLDLIQGKQISSDPDLAATKDPVEPRSRGRTVLIGWVLHRAGKLLRPEDATTLREMEGKLHNRGLGLWYALAAAELRPDKAGAWLRDAIGRYAENSFARAQLAAALWRLGGDKEIDYVAGVFYDEKVGKNSFPDQTLTFLGLIKSQRSTAERKKLVARLVSDPRLDRLHYESLRMLIEIVNGWSKQPVVENLRPFWQRGTWGPETAADLLVVARWRDKLRRSVAQWQP